MLIVLQGMHTQFPLAPTSMGPYILPISKLYLLTLFSDHPIYFDHRASGHSHGVFFLNSNGVDIVINQTTKGQQYLEYNVLGGVLDFYFLAGPTPQGVAQQYAATVGYSTMMPYWGLGKLASQLKWETSC